MKYLSIGLAIVILSCGGRAREQHESTATSDTSKTTNETSCLAVITDPAQWYSLTELSALVGVPEENIDQRAEEKYNSLQYSWDSGRKHIAKAGKIEMEVPTKNKISITIKNLDDGIEKAEKMHKRTFTYEEYFDSYHTLATKEEMKKIDEAIDKKVEEGGEEGKSAKTAKDLLAMAPTEDFSQVSNLGDKANKYVKLAPGLRETRLAVLYGNVAILITVDISDDDSEDLSKAKSVAEAVMSLCD